MKLSLLCLLLFLTQLLSAQIFTEAVQSPPLEGVWVSSIAFSDVDGDGDKDVLITGQNTSDERVSKLYTNNGEGTFTEMTDIPFEGVWASSVAFSDVDGDGDQDVFLIGQNNSNEPIAKLYTNNGAGVFLEITDTPFEAVYFGSVAFSDVDGDGDEDVLLTGQNNAFELITKLYINDGMGIFSELTGTPFDDLRASSVAFSDADGDGDEDVLLTGLNGGGVRITKLYVNDGEGIFSESMGASFEGVWAGSAAFADVDGDGDEDVLLTGQNNSDERIAKLYINDGNGIFTERTGMPFEAVLESWVAFSDVDGDGDEDLLISGQSNTFERISKLYLNDGAGVFTESLNTPFEGVWAGSAAFSDVDSDGDADLLLTGQNNSGERIAELYINEGLTSSVGTLYNNLHGAVEIYPNPVIANNLHVIFKAQSNEVFSVKVLNINGQLVSQLNTLTVAGQQTFSIDISALSPGTYFVQLDNGRRKGYARFIVQ